MSQVLSRRRFTVGTLAAGGVAALGMRPALAQQAVTLRMVWWGAQERAKRTNAAVELFQQANPGVKINTESAGWQDYWPRLATQTAGGNAPDLLQMDYRYQAEYGRRGTLLDLDKFVAGPLDLSSFDKPVIDSGRVDGKLYAISLGTNSTALYYSTAAFDKAGVKMPDHRWTWDDFARLSAEITKASKGEVHGTADVSGNEQAFEVFVRQRGRQLYTDDEKLGFTRDDVAEWLTFWDGLRKSGACVPADVQALYQNKLENSAMIRGKAAMDFQNSNQLVALQGLTPIELGMNMFPNGPAGARPGQYLKPAMLLSVSARTRQPELAAKVISFLVNDPAACKELSVERGIPGSSKIRTLLTPDLDRNQLKMLKYIEVATGNVSPLPPTPPKGAGEVANQLLRMTEAVAFGRQKIPEAADRFMVEAGRSLG